MVITFLIIADVLSFTVCRAEAAWIFRKKPGRWVMSNQYIFKITIRKVQKVFGWKISHRRMVTFAYSYMQSERKQGLDLWHSTILKLENSAR